jgi:putative PIN family toxin of toxin-antitoxin system
MAISKIRIILDTNWYISASISRNSRRTLYELLKNENLEIILSAEILKEYGQVIAREKFKKIIKVQQVNRFLNLVLSKAHVIEITSKIKGSRDLNDNFLLSLSVDSDAHYLITGDLDILVLGAIRKTKIVTLSNFLEQISPKNQ